MTDKPTTIHVLGAGTPTPTPARFGSAFALEIGDEQMMVDCGPAATHKLVKAGLWPTDIDYLFFTHHHFDHDIDYPCFLLCRWDQSTGAENTLRVFGPTLTERITRGILDENEGVFAHDWKARVGHPLSQRIHQNRGGTLPRKPPHVQATDVGPGHVFSGSDWEVTAAPAEHVPAVLGLAGVQVRHAGGQRCVYGRYAALRHGYGVGEGRGPDAVHVLGRPRDNGRGTEKRRGSAALLERRGWRRRRG